MSSFLARIARRAHHTAAELSKAPIAVGATLPSLPLKDLDGKPSIRLDTASGKNIILGVPGAFTPSCSNQVPGYIADYEKFKSKGVKDIYVVAVNDSFVLKAWKEKLAADGTQVKFVSDDQGHFVAELGLAFDASAALGGIRSKRFAIVAESGKVTKVAVEDAPPNVIVTAAEALLKDA